VNEKLILLYSFLGIVISGVAIFLAWRLQQISALRRDAEQRAAAAFEEMNRLTKELRDRGRAMPADPALPPGKRLIQKYSGPNRPTGGGVPRAG
jgi:cytochrome c-type biogenesis protein CcmH/NrfG